MAQNKPKNKKHEHTKAAEEIKDKTASFRLTTNNYEIIKKKADEAKMSMSDYFLKSALKDNSRITPEVMVKLQNVANDATSAVQEYAPDKAEETQKGVDALWQILM